MNKIFNYCTALLVSVAALTLGACTEEYEYTGTTVSGEQVYFSNSLPSTVELSATESSITVPVNRVQRNGALSVNLNVSVPEGSTLTVGNQVSFADGDSVAYLTVNYDPNNIEFGRYDTISVSIADASLATPYGNSTYTFAAGLSEWITSGGIANRTGYMQEGIFSYMYGTDVFTYAVEIQSNAITPGMYRIVSPYGTNSDFYGYYGNSFSWAGDGLNTDIIIDATDPDYVYIAPDFYTGLATEADGMMHLMSYVYYYMINGNHIDVIKAQVPEIFGTLRDGIITIPANSLVCNFNTSLEPEYYANQEIKIALPGYEITDYSSSFTYNGRFIDVADNVYMQGTVTLGGDVARAQYIVASQMDDAEAIVEGLIDGSVEGTEITASGDVSVQMTEGGSYYFIIVTYNAEGEAQAYSVTPFTFSMGGVEQVSWEVATNGTYDQNFMPNYIIDTDDQGNEYYVGNPFGDGQYTTTLYVDANNESHYKIEPWFSENGSLEFYLDMNTGEITFDDVDTGVAYGNYGNIFAINATTVFADQTSQPMSFYTSDGIFAFGMMYYIIYEGQYGWLGGATEIFVPEGVEMPVVQSPAKVSSINGSLKNKKIVSKTPTYQKKVKDNRFKTFNKRNNFRYQPVLK